MGRIKHPALVLVLVFSMTACTLSPQPTSRSENGSTATSEPPPTSTPAAPPPTASPTSVRPTESPTHTPTPVPPTEPPTPTSPLNPAVAAAVAHLAAELDISPEEVVVLSADEVEWRDASLGCPKPGMMYAQVVTPGYWVILKVDGVEYDVHTTRTGNTIALCQSPSE